MQSVVIAWPGYLWRPFDSTFRRLFHCSKLSFIHSDYSKEIKILNWALGHTSPQQNKPLDRIICSEHGTRPLSSNLPNGRNRQLLPPAVKLRFKPSHMKSFFFVLPPQQPTIFFVLLNMQNCQELSSNRQTEPTIDILAWISQVRSCEYMWTVHIDSFSLFLQINYFQSLMLMKKLLSFTFIWQSKSIFNSMEALLPSYTIVVQLFKS